MRFPAYRDLAFGPLTVALALVGSGCAPAEPSPVAPASASEPSSESPSSVDGAENAATADVRASEGVPAESPPSTSENEEQPVAAATAVAAVPKDRNIVDGEVAPGLEAFVRAREETGHTGTFWAGRLPGNGGRDVVIYVPPGVDPKAPFTLIHHFHGTYSEHLEPEAPGVPKKQWVGWDRLSQSLDATDRLAATRPHNVVLVYPFSAGRRIEPEWVGWNNKQYDRLWMKAERFGELHDEVLAQLESALGVPKSSITRVIAEGHSAGGIALWHIAAGGVERGAGVVDEMIFLDASFQDWADGTAAEIESRGLKTKLILVVTDKGIADPWDGRTPWCTTAPKHAAAWPAVAEFCEPLLDRKPNTKPDGLDVSCRTLAHDAAWWPKQARWCELHAEDMRGASNVSVHRTKVPHGKQISHFLGGLELPADLQ